MRFFAFCMTALSLAWADIYMHSPRGSNNRLDDENRDRNNGNRLFDSQNNNRGGANVGNLAYYAGSKLHVEWTAQHSCGGPNNHCEIILQYMCDDRLRDGTTTKTIPENPKECYDLDCDTDVRFGRHESFEYYKSCVNRERNKGLFTSSQKLTGTSAKYTRQNPNGARRGYECPEERDYYPYWYPTPWRDLAILTNDESRCAAYQAASQNVASRYFCDLNAYDLERYNQVSKKKMQIPLFNQSLCEAISIEVDGRTVRGVWKEQKPFGVSPPECASNVWSRDNHLGNVEGGFFASWNLTIPTDVISEQCVMRIRYNITTGDFPHFDNPTAGLVTEGLTAQNNTNGNKNTDPAKVSVYADYGLTENRGYNLRNNPQVEMFNFNDADKTIKLQLAVNTAQYGRTFQDRTHRFAIRPAPAEMAGKNIYNLEVKGKRGNIVQTYPGTEYEFVPQRLQLKRDDDFVHFQWTGSNTNPNNNAGQGRQGSDRSNIVMLRSKQYDEPQATDAVTSNGLPTFGHWGNSYPAKVTDSNAFLGLPKADLERLALNMDDNMHSSGEMSELDDSSTYFNLPPRQCSALGVYHYLSTRNNNFSNRSQKGKILCSDSSLASKVCGPTSGCSLALSGATISYAPGALTSSSLLEVEVMVPQNGAVNDIIHLANNDGIASLSVNYVSGALETATLMRTSSISGEWTEVEGEDCSNGVCTAQVAGNGYFTVVTAPDGGMIALIVILTLLGLGGIGALVYMKFIKN